MEPPTGDAPSVVSKDGLVPLESILKTQELNRRPLRAPDYEKENRALVALAQALADSPQSILHATAEMMLEVFQCDSAGFSLLTQDGDSFFWPAIAGAWQPHLGGGTPRDFGPCGDVLDRDAPLLFTHWERRYPYLLKATPLAEEGLLVPLYVQGKAVGTIWAISHSDRRKFDREDLRQLESLGRFASAAYQAVEATETQRQSAQQGNQARVRAENANSAKDAFLATLSHELRQPLASIVGWVRMLRRGGVAAEQQAAVFETLERNLHSVTQMIDDLLDVSSIVKGKLRLNLKAIDLRTPIERALENARAAAVAKGIEVETLLDPTTPPVLGDTDRLQQVVWNLLWNAVKFTPSGGRISVRLRHEGSRAIIEVTDSGWGISQEFMPQLFTRFRQATEGTTRATRGLGLGLALARDLVELHGGTISAESPGEGRGSTFAVSLPIPESRSTSIVTAREPKLLARACAGHVVAACSDCGQTYRFQELVVDVPDGKFHNCPQCGRDLTASIREHLLSCGTGVMLESEELCARARETFDAANQATKKLSQSREAIERRRAELDARRGESPH